VHVEEHETVVPGLVGHEIDEGLDCACFEVSFGVGVCVVADGVADAPDDVAEAAEIKHVRPQAVIAVKRIVPAAVQLSESRRVSAFARKSANPIPMRACIIHPAAKAKAKLPWDTARDQNTIQSASVTKQMARNCAVGPCRGINGFSFARSVL
jgi:hypothetical protein